VRRRHPHERDDRSSLETRASLSKVVGVAGHGADLYAADPTGIFKLGIAPGSPGPVLFAPAVADSLAASDRGLFYSNAGDVFRCDLAGCANGFSRTTVNDNGTELIAAVDDDVVFTFHADQNSTIHRVDMAAGSATLLTAVPVPGGLAVANGAVWFASCDVCTSGKGGAALNRIAVDGVGGVVSFPRPTGEVISGVAVIGDFVFFVTKGTSDARYRDGALYRVRADGSGETKLLSGLTHPHDLIAVGNDLYWASAGEHGDPSNAQDCYGTDGAIMQLVQ
jgi:hypothetical protein